MSITAYSDIEQRLQDARDLSQCHDSTHPVA